MRDIIGCCNIEVDADINGYSGNITAEMVIGDKKTSFPPSCHTAEHLKYIMQDATLSHCPDRSNSRDRRQNLPTHLYH